MRRSVFKPQDVANMAWVFAKVGQSDAELFAVLARNAERRLSEFNGHGLANMA